VNAELLFPSRYIKCADLLGKLVTKTIKKVAIDTLVRVGGAKEKKPVIWFSDTEKMLVLNKTNCRAIIELYGKETNDWIGKKITLKPDRDKFGGKMVDCVRIEVNGNGKNVPQEEVGMDPVTGEFPDSVQPTQPPPDDDAPPMDESGSRG
jgi:hypothetical protein